MASSLFHHTMSLGFLTCYFSSGPMQGGNLISSVENVCAFLLGVINRPERSLRPLTEHWGDKRIALKVHWASNLFSCLMAFVQITGLFLNLSEVMLWLLKLWFLEIFNSKMYNKMNIDRKGLIGICTVRMKSSHLKLWDVGFSIVISIYFGI